jgi:hypothetical protein
LSNENKPEAMMKSRLSMDNLQIWHEGRVSYTSVSNDARTSYSAVSGSAQASSKKTGDKLLRGDKYV